MSYRTVFNQLGLLGALLSIVMLAMAAAFFTLTWINHGEFVQNEVIALLSAGAVGLVISGATWRLTRSGSSYFGRREALLLVALSWLIGAAVAALPFYFWAHLEFHDGAPHPFRAFVDCYFEAMSGLTTTGATVLSDIEALPHGLILWRALTHWLGGLGIVVLFVAVLPGLGVGGKRLFQIEAPGPAPEGLQPRIRETARWLWYIYLGLTVAEFAALWTLTPMNAYQAVCHTFATLATGGFSTENASVGAFHRTPLVDAIAIGFMVLAGLNFGLYYRMVRGDAWAILRDVEARVYLSLILGATALIAVAVYFAGDPIVITNGDTPAAGVAESARQSLFTTVSIQTTTGFCTADFNRWPLIAKAVLLGLMFIGGSSGSTAGGVKVIRFWIVVKVIIAEIEHIFRPAVVRPFRLGTTVVPAEMRQAAVVYLLGIVLIFAAGTIGILLLERAHSGCNAVTAASGCIATLCNVGPGLAQLGAVENYGWLSSGTKALMSLLMALGRLEVFAIIVLFAPGFWRRA